MDTNKNYAKFIKYLKSYVTRDGIDELIEWLNSSDMAIAPASTKYHLSEPGGLVQHSINVFYRLVSLVNAIYPEDACPYSKETLALVSLLHDISKVNFYEVTSRNVKNPETGVWEQVPYYTVKDDDNRLIYASHEENSVYILSQFLKLTADESLAIRWHSGAYGTGDAKVDGEAIRAFKRSPLALLLNTADMLAICIDEYTNTNTDFNFFNIENDEVSSDERSFARPADEAEDVPF